MGPVLRWLGHLDGGMASSRSPTWPISALTPRPRSPSPPHCSVLLQKGVVRARAMRADTLVE